MKKTLAYPLTLGTQRDADGLGQNVDTSEDGCTALIRELDLLVRTAS